MRKRQILPILAVAAITVAVLSACTPSGEKAETKLANPETATSEPIPTESTGSANPSVFDFAGSQERTDSDGNVFRFTYNLALDASINELTEGVEADTFALASPFVAATVTVENITPGGKDALFDPTAMTFVASYPSEQSICSYLSGEPGGTMVTNGFCSVTLAEISDLPADVAVSADKPLEIALKPTAARLVTPVDGSSVLIEGFPKADQATLMQQITQPAAIGLLTIERRNFSIANGTGCSVALSGSKTATLLASTEAAISPCTPPAK